MTDKNNKKKLIRLERQNKKGPVPVDLVTFGTHPVQPISIL